MLTSFGRTMKITQTISRRLPMAPPVVELDVTDEEHLDTSPSDSRNTSTGSTGSSTRSGSRPRAPSSS